MAPTPGSPSTAGLGDPVDRPDVTATTEALYARLPGYMRDADETIGYPFLRYISLATDQLDTHALWILHAPELLADPATCPPQVLPWLAFIAGVRADLYPHDPDAAAQGRDPDLALRQAIANVSGARLDGADQQILGALRPLLSGTAAADITERDVELLQYTVTVYQAQLPGTDPTTGLSGAARLQRLLELTAPAGVGALLEVLGGWTWNDVDDSGQTWDELAGTDDAPRTWDDVALLVPDTAGLQTWNAVAGRTWDQVEASGQTWTTFPRP